MEIFKRNSLLKCFIPAVFYDSDVPGISGLRMSFRHERRVGRCDGRRPRLLRRLSGTSRYLSRSFFQVYTGLNVITNKVTDSEQRGVPHHLLNFVNPAKGITVIDFRDRALTIVSFFLSLGYTSITA